MPVPSRILLLEGVEASGKSTLREELERRGWGGVHFSFSRAPDRVAEWMEQISEAAVESRDGRVVVDRLHPSCMVYEERLMGRPSISEFDWWVMEGWLLARGGLINMMSSKDWTLSQERLHGKYKTAFVAQELQAQLENMVARSVLPRQPYWPEPDWLHENLPPLPRVADGGMGSRQPQAWLVGDRLNPNRADVRQGTAFAGPGCGEHLFYALKTAGVIWSDIYLSNSVGPGMSLMGLSDLWQTLGRPQAVALGIDAHRRLYQANIPHQQVDHPQYARRFRRYEVFQYGQEILEAMNV